MNIKIKRFISTLIMIAILFNSISPVITQAAPEKRYLTFVNYIKGIEEASGKKWLKPKPVITATTPTGETATEDGSTKPENGDLYFTDRLHVPEPSLTVPLGTVINLDPNKSELGSGWAIDKFDWQIFPPIDPKNGFEYIKDSKLADTKTTSFVADEPGIWRVYLNVADNYTLRYPDGTASILENWSDKGNWTNTKLDAQTTEVGDTGIHLTTWHYTMMTIEVEPTIDIRTETVITSPTTATGNKLEVKTVYSIEGAKADPDLLNKDYQAVIRSPLFGEITETVNFGGKEQLVKSWMVDIHTIPCKIGSNNYANT